MKLEFAGYFVLQGRPPEEGEKDYRRYSQVSDSTVKPGMIPLYKQDDKSLSVGEAAPLQIVAAANKYVYYRTQTFQDGIIETIPCEVVICGHRHFDPVMCSQLDMIKKGGLDLDRSSHVQGFIDNRGEFHDREAALEIALAAGQVNRVRLKSPPDDMLFSEDLY